MCFCTIMFFRISLTWPNYTSSITRKSIESVARLSYRNTFSSAEITYTILWTGMSSKHSTKSIKTEKYILALNSYWYLLTWKGASIIVSKLTLLQLEYVFIGFFLCVFGGLMRILLECFTQRQSFFCLDHYMIDRWSRWLINAWTTCYFYILPIFCLPVIWCFVFTWEPPF